jgi:hypothetical protein
LDAVVLENEELVVLAVGAVGGRARVGGAQFDDLFVFGGFPRIEGKRNGVDDVLGSFGGHREEVVSNDRKLTILYGKVTIRAASRIQSTEVQLKRVSLGGRRRELEEGRSSERREGLGGKAWERGVTRRLDADRMLQDYLRCTSTDGRVGAGTSHVTTSQGHRQNVLGLGGVQAESQNVIGVFEITIVVPVNPRAGKEKRIMGGLIDVKRAVLVM